MNTLADMPQVICPRCSGKLDRGDSAFSCSVCRQRFPRMGDLLCFFADPTYHIQRFRVQQAVFNLQGQESDSVYEAELRKPALLPETRARLEAQLAAVRSNIAELNAVVDPLLSEEATGVPESGPAPEPGEVERFLVYFELLLRDWGWSETENQENARALALIEEAIAASGRATAPLGHVLVLGSGASRLAYELHHKHRPASTTTIDVDIVLSGVAARMVRGDTLHLTEAPSDANRSGSVRAERTLRAPHGALADFQVLLGDGLNPPFARDSFDTVLTPWFIDQVPDDLRDLVGVIDRVLKPGGRWINYGPVIFRKHVPLSRHYTIEEVTALANLGGLEVGGVVQGEWPYLCSPLKLRGRHEVSFAFCATKALRREARVTTDGSPAWLVLPHLPVATFPGSALKSHPHSVYRRVLELLNGETSISEIAEQLGKQANMNPVDLYDSIRAILIEVHPACAGLRASAVVTTPWRCGRSRFQSQRRASGKSATACSGG